MSHNVSSPSSISVINIENGAHHSDLTFWDSAHDEGSQNTTADMRRRARESGGGDGNNLDHAAGGNSVERMEEDKKQDVLRPMKEARRQATMLIQRWLTEIRDEEKERERERERGRISSILSWE